MTVEIDGSHGEGGGQILRTALGLSCLLGSPFKMYDIRKGRKRPGLMPQHLTAVRASALISGARVTGDKEGSTELTFEPAEVRAGEYFFDIGTAGSTSLLAQSLLLPLLFMEGESSLTLKGGTHVPFSPPFHYLSMVFIPMLRRLGLDLAAEIESYGFYPKGGGKIWLPIKGNAPIKKKAITLVKRGEILSLKGVSAVSNLPPSIAERQRDALIKSIGDVLSIKEPDIEITAAKGPGQGTFVFIGIEAEDSCSGFSALGQRGKKAEAVGEEAGRELIDYLRTGACLDPHMADQIVHYLSLLYERSEFTTSKITNHLLTNLWVTERFLGIGYTVEANPGEPGRVKIWSAGGK